MYCKLMNVEERAGSAVDSGEPRREREPSQYPGAPRWVKVTAVVALILAALLAVGLITGHAGPGEHGPGRHLGGSATTNPISAAAQ